MSIYIKAQIKCDGNYGDCKETGEITLRVGTKTTEINIHTGEELEHLSLDKEDRPDGWGYSDGDDLCPACMEKLTASRSKRKTYPGMKQP